MTHHLLTAQLDRLRRRVWGIGWVSGAGWGCFALGATVLAGAWSDLVFELAPSWRLAALFGAIFVGLAFAVVVAWRMSQSGSFPVLARRIDRLAGAHGEIVAGVDLMKDSRAFEPLATGLAGIAIERASLLSRDVSGAAVAPARPVWVSALAVSVLAGATALLALALPRMAQALWLRFSDPFGDHPPYSAAVFHVEPGDIRVVYGQGVEIRAKVEGAPVDRVELVLEPQGAAPERLPMFPEGGGSWRGSVANVISSGRYFVRAEGARARSRRHRIAVITVPRLADVRFRVTPPPYTRRSAYLGPLPAGGLAGLPGARVEAWASSNRPLSGGTIQLTTAHGTQPIALSPTAPGAEEVHGGFEITADGKIEIKVRDVAGQESQEALSAAVVLLRDERPFIRVTEPREVSFATPDVTLPVVLAAEDDYGIARAQLFRGLNGSRSLPIEMPLGSPFPTQWNGQIYLPLADYGLRPGDELTLFARVEDTDPAGAKGSESAVVHVRIIPREIYERLVRAREGMEALAAKYREAERRLESLAGQIDEIQAQLAKLPAESALAAQHEAKLNELARQMRNDTAAIRESARHPLPYDIDRSVSQELESLARALEQIAREAEELAGQGNGQKNASAAMRLAEMKAKLMGGRKQFQEHALAPIEHLARVYPLIEDEARFVQIYLHQRDLAERMAPLKGRDAGDEPAIKARMRDLETEQNQIRSDLAQLLDDIEDHARLLPADERLARLRETAQAFAAAVRSSGAAEAMSDSAAALSAFAGSRALERAKEAADILEKFLARCTGDGEFAGACEGCLKFQPGLAGQLGNSIEQMLADAGLPVPSQFGRAGSGMGVGAGSGYSARQSNLNNVGLYGSRPALLSSSRQGSGRSAAETGAGRSVGGVNAKGAPDANSAAGALRAAGQAQTPIPAAYRRRVADYFERIADEIGDR